MDHTRTDIETGRSTWRRAFSFASGYRSAIIVILVLTLFTGALGALQPLLLKHVFDGLESEATRALVTGIIGLAVLGLLKELVGGLQNWLTWRTRIGVHFRLLEATVGRLHSLPVMWHKKESVGGIMTKMDRGIQGFVAALTEIAFNVLPALVYLGISVVVMVRMEWRLAVLVLVFAPLPALVGAWAATEQTARERTLLDSWSRIYSRFNEVLHGIVTVKSFAMEEVEKRKFLTQVDDANQVVIKGVGRDTGVGAVRNLIVAFAHVAAVGLGGWLVLQGQTTVGTVVAFIGYVTGLFGPVQGLTGIYQTVRKARVSLDTIFEILDHHDAIGDADDAAEAPPLRGEVAFEGVRFGYDDRTPVLANIDLQVPAGETVALVGPSGAGKTTLVTLLQRMYDPVAGRVTVDGRDVRSFKQRSLRRQIGVVLQDALLFDDTIRANITYGRPDAGTADIVAAAKAANAHEFILSLPQGYDTRVGERGGSLSAGQRQRIAIARALLKDPPILILDEATSALDAESEALVQEALARLVKGRTTFVIAHRLATVVGADRILVLRDGTIAESGRHDELLEAGGYYASLVRRQTDGLVLARAA